MEAVVFLAEVAAELNIAKQRAQQTETQALAKLRVLLAQRASTCTPERRLARPCGPDRRHARRLPCRSMTMPDPSASTGPDEESSADPPLLSGLLALTKVAKALHDRGLSAEEIKAALKTALAQNRAKRNQATRA